MNVAGGYHGKKAFQSYPDLSGLTKHSKDHMLAVRDTKLGDDADRLLLVDTLDGSLKPVPVDWSETGQARDLEAIAPGLKKGEYLAVEGSSWNEHKARLMELKIEGEGAKATRSHVLPEFGQEIEGMVSVQGKNGSSTLILAGRGGEGQAARLYWGELSEEGLEFSPEGLAGKAVTSPELGPGQRDIGELTSDENGGLWATATIDEGDEGPFRSKIYKLGHLADSKEQPFQLDVGPSVTLEGTKAEALTFTSQGTLFVGSDDEGLGGQLNKLDVGMLSSQSATSFATRG